MSSEKGVGEGKEPLGSLPRDCREGGLEVFRLSDLSRVKRQAGKPGGGLHFLPHNGVRGVVPPGLGRLSARPTPTRSKAVVKMIGIVPVAFLAARAAAA